MSELIKHLRYAHEHSNQRILGSNIFADAADRIAELETALSQARAEGRREGLIVKPLRWEGFNSARCWATTDDGHTYQVSSTGWKTEFYPYRHVEGGIEAARDSAEAHHEKRILACIEPSAQARIAELEHELKECRKMALEEAARKATSFLVGDPANGVPLRSPMASEIASAIRALAQKEGGKDG